jgi:hypothetical protein
MRIERKFMATFRPYVGLGTKTGSQDKIFYKWGLWLDTGKSGHFSTFEDYDLYFGEPGTGVRLSLSDRDRTSVSGPCHIDIKGLPGMAAPISASARYSVAGSKLAITASIPENQTVTIERGGPEGPETYTYLLLTGKYHFEAQLRPHV